MRYVHSGDILRVYPDGNLEKIQEICLKLLTEDTKRIDIQLDFMQEISTNEISELFQLATSLIDKHILLHLLNISDNVDATLYAEGVHVETSYYFDDYSYYKLMQLLEDEEISPRVVDFLVEKLVFEDEKLVDILSKTFEMNSPLQQSAILLVIGRAQYHTGIEIVRACLEHENDDVKVAATQALGLLGDFESKDQLLEMMKLNSEKLAEAATASVALLSEPGDEEKLYKIYQETDYDRVKTAVVNGLVILGTERSYEIILKEMKSEDRYQLKSILLKKLSYFNKDDLHDVFLDLLDHQEVAVKEAAATGLAKLGSGNDLKVLSSLEEKVFTGDEFVSYFAVKALFGHISDSFAQQLTSNFNSLPEQTKIIAIEALGTTKYDSIDFLIENLNSSNEDVRKEVISSLANLDPAVAVKTSLMVLEDDASWLVRLRAVEVLSQFPEEPIDRNLLVKLEEKESSQHVKWKLLTILGES